MATGKGRIALYVLLGLGLFGAAAAGLFIHGLRGISDEIRTAPGFAVAWEQVAAHPTLIEVLGPPELAPFDPVAFLQGRQSWRFTSHAGETVVSDTLASAAQLSETVTPKKRIARRGERNEIEVPIAGARGRGTLSLASQEVDGTWKVDRLEVRVEGRSGALNLLPTAAPPGGIKTSAPAAAPP